MSGDRPASGGLADLLPAYLAGRLDPDRRRRVESALATSPELVAELAEVARLAELLEPRPESAVLLAHAAGELPDGARAELDRYLEEHDDERELVELARRSLEASGALPTDLAAARARRVPAAAPGARRDPWRALAIAATLVAAVSAWGWLSAPRRPAASAPPGAPPAIHAVRLLELAPADLALRGEKPARAVAPLAEPVVLYLVAPPRAGFDHLRVEVGDPGVAGWRSGPLQPDAAGGVTLWLDAGAAGSGHVELRLLGVRGGAAELIHRYELEIRAP